MSAATPADATLVLAEYRAVTSPYGAVAYRLLANRIESTCPGHLGRGSWRHTIPLAQLQGDYSESEKSTVDWRRACMTGVIGAVIAGVLGSQLLELGPSGTSFLTLLGFMVGYSCTRPHSIAWATFPPRPNMAPDWGMSIFRDGRRDADAVSFRAFIERVQAQILNTRTATSENLL